MAQKRPSHFMRLAAFMRPYRAYFGIALFLTLVSAAIGPTRPYLMQYVLDHPVVEGDVDAVRKWMLIITAMLFVNAGIMYFQIRLTNWLGQTIINDLRKKIFTHILGLRMQYFDLTPIGTLQTRAISDIQTLINVFSEGLVTITGELLQLITILGLMFYTDWRLTLVTLAVLPFLLLATYVFKNKVGAAFGRVRKYVSELNAFLQEHISGMLVTQLFHRQKREYERFEELNQLHTKAHIDTVYYYSIFFPVIEFVAALATALLVWYGARGALEGTITFGVLVAFLMYTQMFFRPIRMLADQFNSLQMGLVSAERIFAVLDTDEHIPDPPNGLKDEVITAENASVVFKNVSFAYNESNPILHDISFEVAPGKTLAIVGATGSGKSTLINLLMRFYEYPQGEILLAGKDLKLYQLNSLHRAVGLVMQDVFVFSGTIMDNITLGAPDISFETVKAAAQLIQADRFIEQLPGGFYYQVSERGSTLSAGQRQLLAFLRVLVHNPKILLLDEATANVDSETEYIIQQAVATVMANRTAVIIAHRLSTIQKADQILVMRRGTIVERGTHQALLEAGGYYYRLYQLQYAQALAS